jgi:hypothetical protein
MTLPAPSPGLVIRYDYLWSRESAQGRAQGKDRPACIVVASDSSVRPRFVVLLPITHSPPLDGDVAIEIPARVRSAIGLDAEPAWIIVSEHNVDEWPSPGVTPIPGKPGAYAYGHLPPALFAEVKKQFIACAESSARVTRNT